MRSSIQGGDSLVFLNMAEFGYKGTLDPTIVHITNCKRIEIRNAIFDDIFITENLNHSLNPLEWDYDTLFWAKFNGTLNAGNVEHGLEYTSDIIIKRRKIDKDDDIYHPWIPLFRVPVTSWDGFSFTLFDHYVANNTEYEYALVPVLEGVESSYHVNSITTSFKGMFVVSKEKIFKSLLEMRYSDEKNHNTTSVRTIDRKFPFIVNHSKNNFYSGDVEGVFVPFRKETCDFDFDAAYKYREDLMEFLANGQAKFLKLEDGRIWMMVVSDNNPKETQDDYVKKFTTSFGWTEVGNVHNTDDYFQNGFIDEETYRYK